MENRERYYGQYGGRYVPEMLIPVLKDLEDSFYRFKEDESFLNDLKQLYRTFSGRPTPLCFAENLTKHCNGARIFLKLESHNHTGAHKINNVLGQALLALKMNRKTIIAETGAGQHGLATAAVAARLGLKCKVFMGSEDVRRQYPNVYNMKLMGAEVVEVDEGSRTLKDAVNAALKYWLGHSDDTYYLLGSALGPYPYPAMVKFFQSVIGKEIREQMADFGIKTPDAMVACVGGGSNSIGMFTEFLSDKPVKLYGVEAGGKGLDTEAHASRFSSSGRPGIAQGYHSVFMQDESGNIAATHSVSAGLDYAGIGPELAWLKEEGRVEFNHSTDEEAVEAFRLMASREGIIPALESSHAVAFAIKLAGKMKPEQVLIINISGRGDKDIFITAPLIDRDLWKGFLKREYENE